MDTLSGVTTLRGRPNLTNRAVITNNKFSLLPDYASGEGFFYHRGIFSRVLTLCML